MYWNTPFFLGIRIMIKILPSTRQLFIVLLLDVLQLLMLSAGTSMSLEIIMFPLNIFYCKQDTVFMLSIYLIVCVQKSILFYFIFFRSIILCTFVDI
jgi:hypothetical protein